MPLAEPVIDPLYSPRHEAFPPLEINRYTTERVAKSTSLASSMTDGMEYRARETSPLMDNDGIPESRSNRITGSGPKAKPNGDRAISIPDITQTENRVQSHPQPFARTASESYPPEWGGRISKEPQGDTPPGGFKGKSYESGRIHISARMKRLENSPDQKMSLEAQESREKNDNRSPSHGIERSKSERGPVDSGSVPITSAASRSLMAEEWQEAVLQSTVMESKDRRGPEALTAQPIERSTSRFLSRISDWERPGPRIGDETRRTGTPAKIIEQPQSIRVTIGRIDVRAVTRQQPANPKPTPPAADRVPSLEEYMRKRNGGNR